VIATAGHVDHGKSTLIQRLTGIDPDRWDEEKRRGLTIDLGYAWTTLPSGREVGFVDVPGHQRFIGNMLAGVGPVRLVLFVVAADEGWRPQSEEHLQILDVLGVSGSVVALTKRDLVDEETLAIAVEEVRERTVGTALEGAPIVPVSASTGTGLGDVAAGLDAMLETAAPPQAGRTRLFVDRVFTVKGAGTVATGTLEGGTLHTGDEVELLPLGERVRVRSLQTHRRAEDVAEPVSRVAVNLVGIERDDLARGDVVAEPGVWRPTTVVDASLRPVRGLGSPLTARGAFRLYAGAAEVDAAIRLLDVPRLEPGREAFARLRLSAPLTLDVGDRFVVREAGRRATVAGGIVLDVAPPRRAGTAEGAADRLRKRVRVLGDRAALGALVVDERGAVRIDEVRAAVGAEPATDLAVGGWLVAPHVREAAREAAVTALRRSHAAYPLRVGAPMEEIRRVVAAALRTAHAPADAGLVDALLVDGVADGRFRRDGLTIGLSTHRVELDAKGDEVTRLLGAIGGEREATPPTVKELIAAGFPRDVIDAAVRAGLVVGVSPDLVLAPSLIERAEAEIRRRGSAGITISDLREALGTSRKYAVPLAEWLDRSGLTRREGDLRFLRETEG
jgi:selenocysteine-specific elongation factor